ncbi:hypothetical protein K435DRAFT_865756 [Dendrothele bispora CBS 962.96]|uniref:Uncharacterized protein n=1 Tax=Dendrothele bispora (strain CBS 962.96) TaxID=1314807 RepID=A0A4S8LIP4_DENBC|nr:hypothetical protein K435DRAFT_865756 [Dendrothele bispora CBS 962.96]
MSKPVDSKIPQKTESSSASTATTSFMHGVSRFAFDKLNMQIAEGSTYEVGDSSVSETQGRNDFFKDTKELLQRMEESSSQNPSTSRGTATVSFFSNATDFAVRDAKLRHVQENQFNFSENTNRSLIEAVIREAKREGKTQDLNDSQAPQEEPETESLC